VAQLRPVALAAYTRVSTQAQAESGLGLAAQRTTIEDAARTNGFTVAAWHVDAGRSGASMRGRTGLRDALADVSDGRADGIVCAKIDRLGRSSADVLGLVERAQREGWRLLVLDVGLDTGTPAGELVATALAMASRFEYRRISERQREKFHELRRAGRPRGRPAVPTDVADRMRAWRAEGMTLRAIAIALVETKVPTSQGGTTWHASSVRAAINAREAELAAQQD
jgi:DNA invertase Pin-like site-specific DNA recombinase